MYVLKYSLGDIPKIFLGKFTTENKFLEHFDCSETITTFTSEVICESRLFMID